MKRRNFIKEALLLPAMLAAKEIDTETAGEDPEFMNILEYVTMTVTFEFENEHAAHQLFVVNQTLDRISKLEKELMLIHYGSDGFFSMYDTEIDALFCSLDAEKRRGLDYPILKLEYREKTFDLPSLSLLVKMQHPAIRIYCPDSILFQGCREVSGYINNLPYAPNDLLLKIEGDLHYVDASRLDKRFDLRKL